MNEGRKLSGVCVCKRNLFSLDIVLKISTIGVMNEIRILELIWDSFNEAHIWERHQLTSVEVEEEAQKHE